MTLMICDNINGSDNIINCFHLVFCQVNIKLCCHYKCVANCVVRVEISYYRGTV